MMAQGHDGQQTLTGYFAQADTLFKFIRETFHQMPVWVQIVAYFAILFLFIFLMVYPLVGITYFQVKIEPVVPPELKAQWECLDAKDSHRWPLCLNKGLKVTKEDHTYTNDNGEFTLAVRMVNLPILQQIGEKFLEQGVEFEIADSRQGVVANAVVIPAPITFLSFFKVNPQKIFYAPSSNQGAEKGRTRRFFFSREEAWEAAKVTRPKIANDVGVLPGLRTGVGTSASGLVGAAAAAEQSYNTPTFTLRVHRFQLTAAAGTHDVYFRVQVDGKERLLDGVPDKRSPHADQITVVRDEWRAQELDIPLVDTQSRVTIDVLETPMWLFGGRQLGSVTIAPEGRVGVKTRVFGGGVAVEWELLPPVAIGTLGIAVAGGEVRSGAWLKVPEQYWPRIRECSWFSQTGLQRVVGREFCYWGSVRTRPRAVAAAEGQVVFEGGSVLRLAVRWEVSVREPKTLEEFYTAIDIARVEGNEAQAVAFADQALKVKPDVPAWVLQQKGAVLRDLGRLGQAAELYREVLKREPNDSAGRTGYALTLAELPDAGQRELLDARRLIEDTLKNEPSYDWGLIALGALQVRLGELAPAVETLARARRTARKSASPHNPILMQLDYFASVAYQKLGRVAEARAALDQVVANAKADEWRSLASQKFQRKAESDLKRL